MNTENLLREWISGALITHTHIHKENMVSMREEVLNSFTEVYTHREYVCQTIMSYLAYIHTYTFSIPWNSSSSVTEQIHDKANITINQVIPFQCIMLCLHCTMSIKCAITMSKKCTHPLNLKILYCQENTNHHLGPKLVINFFLIEDLALMLMAADGPQQWLLKV